MFYLKERAIEKHRKYLLVVLRTLLWVFAGVIGLFLLIVIALQFSGPQNFVKDKVVNYLENKLQTPVDLAEVSISLPKKIVLKGLYLEDQHGDTLLHSGLIKADINLFSLFSYELTVNSLLIENGTAHINRTTKDSLFNFDYILTAFATDTLNTTAEADTTRVWKFALGDVTLKNVFFTFYDEVEGIDILSRTGNLTLDAREIDPNENKYYLRDLAISNTTLLITENKKASSEKEPLQFDIDAENITLKDVLFNYENVASSEKLNLKVGTLDLAINEINREEKMVEAETLAVENTDFHYQKGASAEKKGTANNKPGKAWAFTIDELSLKNSGLKYDDVNVPEKNNQLDYAHLALSNINADAEDVFYSPDELSANVNQLSFNEKGSLDVKRFTAEVRITDTRMEFRDLVLETSGSRISDNVTLSYPSLENIEKNINELVLNADLDRSRISLNELRYIQPQLINQRYLKTNGNSVFNISGQIRGSVNDFTLNNFALSNQNNTRLFVNARIKGLPDVNSAYFDVDLRELATTDNELYALIPPNTLPQDIVLPERINLAGNFKGTVVNFTTNAKMTSSLGNATANLEVKKLTGSRNRSFKGTMSANDLELGKVLQDPTYGQFSFTANVNGTGLRKENLDATLQAVVSEAVYKGYSYNNITVDGAFKQKQFTGKAAMRDDNVAFAFDGTVNFSKADPHFNFTMDIYGADLQALNLADNDIRFKANITSDLSGGSLNNLTGQLTVKDVLVLSNGNRYPVDTFLFVTLSETADTAINIKSDLMSGHVTGTINLGDLPGSLKRHINKHFALAGTPAKAPAQPQNFNFRIDIKNTALLTEVFIPQLERLEPGTITGSFNSMADTLALNVNVPEFTLEGKVEMDSLKVNVASDPQKLTYSASLASLKNKSRFFKSPSLKGEAANNKLTSTLSIAGEEDKQKLLLGGTFTSLGDAYRFSLNPSEVVFNYTTWNVPADNYIQFGNKNTSVHNLRLESGGQFIAANTIQRGFRDSALQVTFGNLDLAAISNFMVAGDTLLAGIANGNIIFEDYHTRLAFTSDIKITGFGYREDVFGDLTLLADNIAGDKYNLNIALKGNSNDISAQGYYLADTKEGSINLNLDVRNLDLNTVKSLTFGEASEMAGNVNGSLKLTGTLNEPSLNGHLNMNNTLVNLAYFNSDFRVNNEKITFDNRGISFDTFTVLDSLGNKAVVNGQIYTSNYADFYFDLDARTRNFMLFNTTSPQDNVFYGKVFVTSNTQLKGNNDLPIITTKAALKKGTSVTLSVPEAEIARVEREGIVGFVDKSEKLDSIFLADKERDTVRSRIKGVILNSTIEIDKQTLVNVLIDPQAGDRLQLRGGGTLSYDIDQSGKISLNGRYDIDQGQYKLSYSIIRKNFKILPGGSIAWAGSPYEGKIDLTALYRIRTSPAELVENQIGLGSQNRNLYRTPLPFEVYINIKGSVISPAIDFTIDMDEDYRGAFGGAVYARLQQVNTDESEATKQAFSLIALNRFMAEDPFQGSNPGSAFARTSVSNVLTQQFNRLSGKFLPGVNVEFDVHSYDDYASGYAEGRTDVGVTLSKQFASNRLNVSVGSSFTAEGDRAPQSGSTSELAGDASLEYNITKDGRLRLRAFRENEYEGLIEGEVIETGLSLVFARDYDSFRELFIKPEEPVPDEEETEEEEEFIEEEGPDQVADEPEN